MTEEFDKEIDLILQQAARQGGVLSETPGTHLDADEINAFVEHSLPAKARFRAVEHLADCSRCRNILSNIAVFNAQEESGFVSAPEIKKTAIPWYKKLFTFPQMAYSMGALALIFSGIVAILIFQTSTRNNSSDLAQVEEKSAAPYPTAPASNMSANSNMAMSNASSSSATTANISTMSANSSNTVAMSSNTSPAKTLPENLPIVGKNGLVDSAAKPSTPIERDDDKAAQPEATPAPVSEESELARKEKAPSTAGAPPPPAPSAREDKSEPRKNEDGVLSKQQADTAQNSIAQNQSRISPDSRNVQSSAINGRNVQSTPRVQAAQGTTGGAGEARAKKADAAKDEKASETRSVGGKTFRYANGAWYDTRYTNQKTVNISRNSAEYKNLSSGVRSIAENIGGVVVIVSGNKAYRIQ